MSSNKLFIQKFRKNDLKDHTGSQIEFGKDWLDFFEIDPSEKEVSILLVFKALDPAHVSLNDRPIELKLSEQTGRGDRKTYASGSESGHSALKEFFFYELHLNDDDNKNDYFAIYKASELNYYLYFIPQLLYSNFLKLFESVNPSVSINKGTKCTKCEDLGDWCLQKIFYGAPGTGKSNTIKKEVDEKGRISFRTTFHPDSDYSTFVGTYKPAMKENVISKNGIETKEEQIVYRFIPQAFTKAYTTAWNTEEDVYLIIEEINRGNCAQIFGDLFQLLDRRNGISEYPVDADSDLADHIYKELYNSPRTDFPKGVKEGKKLVLPSNLYIWATMNTSDQSLFPIDSAFKRRWDWEYVKITEGKDPQTNIPLGWQIMVTDEEEDRVRLYDWWRFLKLINKKIYNATQSADKQMGYFFVKAKDNFTGEKIGEIIKEGFIEELEEPEKKHANCITAETFVNKVLFYLWTDVLKDNEYEEIASLMKKGETPLAFADFFDETGVEISSDAIRAFLDNVMKDEEIRCELAEWNVDIKNKPIDFQTISTISCTFKPKSMIVKITDDINDKDALYKRAKNWWWMAEKRATTEVTEYVYVYSAPLKRIVACYKVNEWTSNIWDGKKRFGFEGVSIDDPMIGQPVDSIEHVRGQVVFYPKTEK